jgi:hypothetical protein
MQDLKILNLVTESHFGPSLLTKNRTLLTLSYT